MLLRPPLEDGVLRNRNCVGVGIRPDELQKSCIVNGLDWFIEKRDSHNPDGRAIGGNGHENIAPRRHELTRWKHAQDLRKLRMRDRFRRWNLGAVISADEIAFEKFGFGVVPSLGASAFADRFYVANLSPPFLESSSGAVE